MFFGRRSDGGQAILLLAIGASLLIALGGLAIDASDLYLVRRQGQNAVDFAAFAAGKQLASSIFTLSAPPRSGDPSVLAAHDFAALNGFNTVYSSNCDTATSSSFTAVWFDTAGTPCAATSGFITKVQVNVPAIAVNNIAIPSACQGPTRFACFQVTAMRRVDTSFARAFGYPSYYFTVSAVVLTTPQIQGYTLPPPVAAYLYQPQSGCNPAAQQCFNEAAPASRTNLSCTGGNCPTFWVRPGTHPAFNGTDGNVTIPIAGDIVTLESNGDMVVQDTTTFCDPYSGRTCRGASAVGAKGFALASGSTLYCGGFTGGGSANGLIPCTTAGQTPLANVAGNETSFASLATWRPTIDTSGLTDCGALVLNGDTVANSFTIAGAPACSSTSDPYTIQPGRYRYIVVNHGTYDFQSGLYDLTGVAPVNTVSGGSYRANGIDHSREMAGADFDLCTGGTAVSCPTLTASVWIGHGAGWYGAFSQGTLASCNGGGAGTSGGGGDATVIEGTGVSFLFESTAGGFVSTHETHGIILSSPGIGALTSVGGVPILFDVENSSFVHVDASGAGGEQDNQPGSQFGGLIFQTNTATAGGVEINPGLAGQNTPAVVGQIFAYSLTTFGTSGPAIDFTGDFGGISQPTIQTSGNAELEIVSSTSLTQAVDATGNAISGWETLTVNYTDEWALDAYDIYIKINNSQPVFFSQGIWSPTPAPGAALPPANNNPGDAFPANPGSAPAGYTAARDPITGQMTDWTYTVGSGANAPRYEVYGNWTWGHQRDLTGAQSGNYRAVVKYTFPTPAGTQVNVTTFLTDGDHCGDYYLVSAHFNNVGQPNQGAQSAGSVVLVR